MRGIDLQTVISNAQKVERSFHGQHHQQAEHVQQMASKKLQEDHDHLMEEVQKPEDPEQEAVQEKREREPEGRRRKKRGAQMQVAGEPGEPEEEKRPQERPNLGKNLDLTA